VASTHFDSCILEEPKHSELGYRDSAVVRVVVRAALALASLDRGLASARAAVEVVTSTPLVTDL